MFGDNLRILHGHRPTGEIDHPPAMTSVPLIKRSSVQADAIQSLRPIVETWKACHVEQWSGPKRRFFRAGDHRATDTNGTSFIPAETGGMQQLGLPPLQHSRHFSLHWRDLCEGSAKIRFVARGKAKRILRTLIDSQRQPPDDDGGGQRSPTGVCAHKRRHKWTATIALCHNRQHRSRQPKTKLNYAYR